MMAPMSSVRIAIAHTANLDSDTRAAARALLYGAFDDMTEHDWEHALGGIHALAWDTGALVGHASVVQRRLLHRSRALRAGYVEGVAVRAGRRREGIGAAMMTELERVIRAAYDLGTLGASDDGAALYAKREWRRWLGPTSALTPNGIVRTPEDDGYVFVLAVTVELHLNGELTCDWREGDPW
jgi:aminoglycoside 2'-N-acetyltransferase I